MSDKKLAVDVDKFYEGRNEIGHVSDESGSLSFLHGTNSAIINHIFALTNQGGYSLSEILILTPNWSIADEIFERIPQSIKKKTRVSKHFREDEMIITTYHSSKGLERKVVILVDVDSIKEKKVLYVGVTRASEALYIHSYVKQKGSNCDFLESLIK
jgi:ATP-dependent exoDNAse (exonuclease V) beta subunit